MTEVTLFDLDGVLTKGDTMASLVSRRLAQHPSRLLKAVPLFLLTLASYPESDLKSSVNRKLVALALKGLTDEKYTHLAAETGRNLAAKPGFAIEQAITACRLSASRSRTIIVTASERRLARAFLNAAGLPDTGLLASELQVRDDGLHLTTHNVGEAKVVRLVAAGVDLRGATFYTDSATDIPLARAAGRTILVNAGRRTRARMEAAVPGSENVRWV